MNQSTRLGSNQQEHSSESGNHNSTARKGKRIRRRVGQPLKPRQRDEYSNEKYGWDDDDREDLLASPFGIENGIQSKVLAKRNDGSRLDTKDAWHRSTGYGWLDPEQNGTGIWVPQWVGRAMRNARLARLLSWLLWWFDDESTRSRHADRGMERYGSAHDGSLCRARGRDAEDNRVLVTSVKRLADEVNVSRGTIVRLLAKLEAMKLISVERNDVGRYRSQLLVAMKALGLARIYYEQSDDQVAYEEILDECSEFHQDLLMTKADRANASVEAYKRSGRSCLHTKYNSMYVPGWYESRTRERAMTRHSLSCETGRPLVAKRGVFVHDLVLAMCQGKHAPACLLSQSLWWFSLRTSNEGQQKTRSRIVRHGFLWIAKSDRQWEVELGIPRSDVQRAREYLTDERHLLVTGAWVVDRRRDRNQCTVHLRPNTRQLTSALLECDVQDLADHFASRRLEGRPL